MDMQEQLRRMEEEAQGELSRITDRAGLDALRLKMLGKKGELTQLLRSMGQLPAQERPQAGQMINAVRERLTARMDELDGRIRKLEQQKKLERRKQMRETRVDVMTRSVRQEIDVRGLAVDEAIPEVQKFIDDAVISSLGEVSIIHGVGTGILRAGIHDCLRRHPSVASFRLGRYGEGEAGVTIVSLR